MWKLNVKAKQKKKPNKKQDEKKKTHQLAWCEFLCKQAARECWCDLSNIYVYALLRDFEKNLMLTPWSLNLIWAESESESTFKGSVSRMYKIQTKNIIMKNYDKNEKSTENKLKNHKNEKKTKNVNKMQTKMKKCMRQNKNNSSLNLLKK